MEDKYKSFTGAELASEDAFIRWIIKGENHSHWEAWQHNNPDRTETISEASGIVKTMMAIPSEQLTEQERNLLWNKINSTIKHHKQAPVTSRKSFSIFRWSIAAAAMLALLLWVNSITTIQKVTVDAGEQKEVSLPESSQVIVNAESKISFHKTNFADDREVKLEGEAFFNVKSGSQFVVNSDYGKVTVLGTSFNVIAREGRFEVSCHTGKVRVSKEGSTNVEITAGQKVFAEGEQFQQSDFNLSGVPEWTHGKFKFIDQPLSYVIDELERQYNVKIVVPEELRNIRYTGLFERGNLNNALYTITWPLHLKYEIRGTSAVTVIISR